MANQTKLIDTIGLTKAKAIQILKQYDSTLIFKGFAAVGDATPAATLNHAYIVKETGTVFGVAASEGQVIVGDGIGFEAKTIGQKAERVVSETQAIQLLRVHNPELVFQGFADTGTATPVHTAKNAWIITESGTVFGVAGCVKGQFIWSDGSSFVVEYVNVVYSYPFNIDSTFEGEDFRITRAILDVEIKGGNKNWRVVPYTFERGDSNGHYIRLFVFKEDNTIDTAVGNNGNIAYWYKNPHAEPSPVEGKILEVINFDILYGIDSCRMLVDWGAIPNGKYGIGGYKQGGFDQRVFLENRINDYVSEQKVMAQIPDAEIQIWNKENTFSALPELKDAIIDIQVFGNIDLSKNYAIGNFKYDDSVARNFMSVYEYDSTTGAVGQRVALWDKDPYTYPSLEGKRRIETITLNEDNGSGITIQMTIDFAMLPSGSGIIASLPMTDMQFSSKLLHASTVGPVIGHATINFQVNGVNSQIITPNDYDSRGKASYCLMYIHGNGGTYQDAGSVNWKNFCKANNIAIITTQGQDEVSAPFMTNASGWGNYVQLQRYVALYKYCQDNYNLSSNVILSAGSMGGLIAGQILYNKPFPITAAILIGPVPDLSYIFANGGESRRAPIRNAYGMASDGSDDANLEMFIQGYDWFDLGLIEVSGVKYKIGFPRIYIYIGTGDTTFNVDFGGTTKFNELVNSLKAAGGYVSYTEIGLVSHAATECFDQVIIDRVFEKELGL